MSNNGPENAGPEPLGFTGKPPHCKGWKVSHCLSDSIYAKTSKSCSKSFKSYSEVAKLASLGGGNISKSANWQMADWKDSKGPKRQWKCQATAGCNADKS